MTSIRIVRAFALLLLLAAALPIAPRARAAGPALLVVVGIDTPVKDIAAAMLRRCFLGLPTDYGPNKRFVPVNHPAGSPTRVAFDRAVLGLEPSAMGAFWIDRRIRDESPPPRAVATAALALKIAGSVPGGITYITPDQLNASVKAITVEGKDIKSVGYLLK